MIFLHTKYFPNYLTRMNFHLTFKKYFFLKCKYILVTSDSIRSANRPEG